jgi:nicotinamide mononucleotide (NMN) deamidase PncC
LDRLNFKLSVVETFTGGIISQKLTGTGSISFVQGLILFSDSSQMQFLNMSEEEFNFHARNPKGLTDLLAQKVRNEFKTDFGLAMVAKIAEEQKRGEYRIETYNSLSTPYGIENQEYPLGGELWMVRERASIIALDLLRKYLFSFPLTLLKGGRRD